MTKLISIDETPTAPVQSPASASRRLLNGLVVVMPWAIIGGLLWAGLFIKPRAVGASVTPPALERRDQFYGLAQLPSVGVLACGSNGKILAVGADGRIQHLSTPTRNTLQDIAAWDASHLVAVGNDGVILRSEDAGASWSAVADVPRSEVANKLNRVRVGKDGLAVASGEMGALLVSRDYGRSWQRLRDEEDVAWNDVALLDDGRLLVVGEFGRILLGDDQGRQWEEVPPPVPGSLMAVGFRDALDGAAVGVEGTLLVTHDGGRQWSRVELGINEHLFRVQWSPERKQWLAFGAMGRWVTGTPSGNGIDWKVGTLDARDLTWHTASLVADGQVWLAGAGLGRWDGQRWAPLSR